MRDDGDFASTHLVLFIPAPNLLKVTAFVMRTKIRPPPQRRFRIIDEKQRRCIGLTHEGNAKSLDTMVRMHSSAHITHLHVFWRIHDIWMSQIPIMPSILADHVLANLSGNH
jgi:hypothetical protein